MFNSDDQKIEEINQKKFTHLTVVREISAPRTGDQKKYQKRWDNLETCRQAKDQIGSCNVKSTKYLLSLSNDKTNIKWDYATVLHEGGQG